MKAPQTTDVAPVALQGLPLCGSFSLVLPYLQGRKLADLGCNEGYYLAFGGPGSQGLDVSSENVKKCSQKGLSAKFHDLNVLPLPLSDRDYQVVLASHVLEHVHAPLRLLMEMNRILAPSGTLILGLPIEDSLYSRMRMDYYGGQEGHIYSFSRKNLHKLLTITGFSRPRFLLNLPVLGFRPWPKINQLVQHLPLSLLYQMSGAYWAIATKVGSPEPDTAFSSYFREGK